MVGAPLLRGTHVAGSAYSASESITVSRRLHQALREVPDARWLTETSHSLWQVLLGPPLSAGDTGVMAHAAGFRTGTSHSV